MISNWTDFCALSEAREDDVVGVDFEGRNLALYSANGDLFVTDNLCTHGHALLCDGYLEGFEIECPLHQGRFDIRTGKALCAPLTADVKTYPIKIEDGRIFIDLSSV